jgi:hypothetical protein
MRKKNYSEEQIIRILDLLESGMKVADICRGKPWGRVPYSQIFPAEPCGAAFSWPPCVTLR